MVKKSKKQGDKVQKVVTIIKARGVPDEVKVEQSTEAQSAQPQPNIRAMRAQARLPRSNIRITPKMPRLR